MINDPFHPEEAIERQRESNRRILFAVVCAFALTAILLAGYAYFRRRHAQDVLLSSAQVTVPENLPKGPPLANVVIDEPLLEKGTTILRGSVKNISKQPLSGVSITLELRRRRDAFLEERQVPISPAALLPDQEGTYALKLPAQEYGSIRLVALKADPQSTLITYSTSPGKKRPPEKLESRSGVVKSPTRSGEFLNTPDNPGRLP